MAKHTITVNEYKTLLRDRAELAALHAAGVDDWEGYDKIDWESIDINFS